MISVEEALERILNNITALKETSVPLASSQGLVLAQDIIAQGRYPSVREFRHGWLCAS